MKLQVLSDYHFEFGPTTKIRNVGADVLVLAGDITTIKSFYTNGFESEDNLDMFKYFSDSFRHIVYVLGNHEYYHSIYNDGVIELKHALSGISNIHILDNQKVNIDGVNFIGSTLWTNMNNNCPLTQNYLRNSMNDFRLIQYRVGDGYTRFTPEMAYILHNKALDFINNNIDNNTVVVTHHGPSRKSIHEKYANDHYMNGGYCSDLELIFNDNIKYWIHGHVHNPFDYKVNNTRVICNPHGYRGEGIIYNNDLILDI